MQNAIETRILAFKDSTLGSFITKSAIAKIEFGPQIYIELVFGFPVKTWVNQFKIDMQNWLHEVFRDQAFKIEVTSKILSHASRPNFQALSSIKNIIAVASGKGGVGKSTIAVNLALGLSNMGASVGLLDADIYGPSQPQMLGTKGLKPKVENNKFIPIKQHHIQSMSIGYLVEDEVPLAWRGPMLGKALQQLLNDTNWDALDYLIIDLPPGTGDVQLTLCQKVPVTAAVIVTTPQDIALIDVRRACEMFQKLNVPIAGVVENMSVYVCAHCGHAENIFGEGAASKLSHEYQLQLLGQVPLRVNIREKTDEGNPPALYHDSASAIFFEIALKLAAKITTYPKDYSVKFPKIVIQKDQEG